MRNIVNALFARDGRFCSPGEARINDLCRAMELPWRSPGAGRNPDRCLFPFTRRQGRVLFCYQSKRQTRVSRYVWGVAKFEEEYVAIERLRAGLDEIVQVIDEKQVRNKMRDAIRANPTLLYYTLGFYSSRTFYSAGGTLVPAGGQENTPLPLLQASLGSEPRS
jgi:hypothetical protein